MAKYAPAREDGLKPYVVEVSEWGRKRETVVYAAKSNDATYQAVGRSRYAYGKARRATPDDLERLAFPRTQLSPKEED